MISVLKPCAVGPLQIHAQQHRGPVLRLGAAGARLDVEKGVVRIHLARNMRWNSSCSTSRLQPIDVGSIFRGGADRLLGREIEQFAGVAQAAREPIQAADDLFELGALLAELLRAIRLVPDAGLFEFARYFLQALVLVVVIKDTPSRSRCAPRDL
jgi:hypothetical protein